MNWFYKMSLKAKLLTGFTIITLLAAAIGVFGMFTIRQIDQAGTAMYELSTIPIGEIGDTMKSYQRVRVNLRDMILESDPAKRQNLVKRIDDIEKDMNGELAKFEKTIKAEAMRKEFDALKSSLVTYKAIQDEVEKLGLVGQ